MSSLAGQGSVFPALLLPSWHCDGGGHRRGFASPLGLQSSQKGEGGAMSAATQPRVSSEAAGEAAENRRGECGLVSEGSLLVSRSGSEGTRSLEGGGRNSGLALPGTEFIGAFHALSILGETLFCQQAAERALSPDCAASQPESPQLRRSLPWAFASRFGDQALCSPARGSPTRWPSPGAPPRNAAPADGRPAEEAPSRHARLPAKHLPIRLAASARCQNVVSNVSRVTPMCCCLDPLPQQVS